MVEFCVMFGSSLRSVGVRIYPFPDEWAGVVEVGCVGAAVLIDIVHICRLGYMRVE